MLIRHNLWIRAICFLIAATPLFNYEEAQAERRGISIHVGLNFIDPGHYAGDDGALSGCLNDANDMAAIAEESGFEVQDVLLNQDATKENVLAAISNSANELDDGDILLFTYAGHGSHTADVNGDEYDDMDETLCLYDGQLLDDYLFAAWEQFGKVRILFISDSCRSGSVARQLRYQRLGDVSEEEISDVDVEQRVLESNTSIEAMSSLQEAFRAKQSKPRALVKVTQLEMPRYRYLPADIAFQTWLDNRQEYEDLGRAPEISRGDQTPIEASVLLLSGCQDNQFSQDGPGNGKFTHQLKQVLARAEFATYPEMHYLIVEGDRSVGIRPMPEAQTPNYYWATEPDPEFENQMPFSID
jgi:metacaspase-1